MIIFANNAVTLLDKAIEPLSLDGNLLRTGSFSLACLCFPFFVLCKSKHRKD